MRDEEKAFYEYHGCLVEPWDGPAALAFTDGDADRRHARSQRPAPGEVRRHDATASSSWRASSASCDSSPRASSRRAACSRARCSSSTPTTGRIVSDDEIKHQVATQKPYARVGRREQDRPRRRCPRRRASYTLAARGAAQRCSRRSATRDEDLQDASSRRWPPAAKSRSARMGIDIPLAVLSRAPAAALPLLQAAVRAGHESADRSDPRRDRDVARELRRRRGQPARGDAASSAACSSCRTRS